MNKHVKTALTIAAWVVIPSVVVGAAYGASYLYKRSVVPSLEKMLTDKGISFNHEKVKDLGVFDVYLLKSYLVHGKYENKVKSILEQIR